MTDASTPRPKRYKVTLKTGESAVFSNDNNYPDYPSRLVSGIYGIMTSKGNTLIIPQNVEKIEEVEDE